MFILQIPYDDAAEFVQSNAATECRSIDVGETSFVPCKTAANDLVYVMFGVMGETALLGDGLESPISIGAGKNHN